MPRTVLVSHIVRRGDLAERVADRMAPLAHLVVGDRGGVRARAHAVSPGDVLEGAERPAIREEAKRWLKGLPAAPVDREVFAERLVHRGASLWWWLESPLWFGDIRNPALPPLPDVLEELVALRALVETKSADAVVFASEVPSIRSIAFREFSAAMGIDFQGRRWAAPWPDAALDRVRPPLIGWVFRRRRRAMSRVAPRAADCLLVSHRHALRPVRRGIEDVYLGPLRDELSRRNRSVATCYVDTIADANPVGRVTRSVLPGTGFTLEQAIGPGPSRAASHGFRRILTQWRRLASGAATLLVWRGIRLPVTFRQWMGRLLIRHGPPALYYLEAFDELLRTWRPRSVAITNETGYAGRAALVACRRHGIPSLGVQHGVIDPDHIEYVSPAELLNPDNEWSCPIPDVTAVDGAYYERLLQQRGGYPPGATLVTGQMRYEAYTTSAEGAPQGVRAGMVIATQPVGGRHEWLRVALEALNGTAPLTVKVHPTESMDAYRSIVESAGTAVRLVRDVDLDELLRTSALLLTRSSTTIVEAAIAGCPAIVFNPFGVPDPVFVNHGGAIAAHSPPELRILAREVLQGGPAVRQLEAARGPFLAEFAFGGAHGASVRVADLVEKMLREGRAIASSSPRRATDHPVRGLI